MSHQYRVTLFRAEQLQKLRNVKIHSPSIIQIITGSKRLFWKESALDLSHSELLLCEASASLSFENLPQKVSFSLECSAFIVCRQKQCLNLARALIRVKKSRH